MESEYRKAFYHKGERLYSYPIELEGEDFQQATMEQLAFQRGCWPEDIKVFLEECAPKERSFAHDCAIEQLEAHDGKERWRILNVATGCMYTHAGSLDSFVEKYEAGEV